MGSYSYSTSGINSIDEDYTIEIISNLEGIGNLNLKAPFIKNNGISVDIPQEKTLSAYDELIDIEKSLLYLSRLYDDVLGESELGGGLLGGGPITIGISSGKHKGQRIEIIANGGYFNNN